jgi:hypothetical protein
MVVSACLFELLAIANSSVLGSRLMFIGGWVSLVFKAINIECYFSK